MIAVILCVVFVSAILWVVAPFVDQNMRPSNENISAVYGDPEGFDAIMDNDENNSAESTDSSSTSSDNLSDILAIDWSELRLLQYPEAQFHQLLHAEC